MRNEAFSRQVRAIEVATSEPYTANIQLASDADGYGLQVSIQQIDLKIGDRASDRYDLPGAVPLALPGGHVYSGFRRAIEIVQCCRTAGKKALLQRV